MIAFLSAAAVSASLALIPTFRVVAPFSWIFGMALAGVLYAVVSGRGRVTEGGRGVPGAIIPSQVRVVTEGRPVVAGEVGEVGAPVSVKGS